MKIWILERGTRQEGGSVVAIYRTEADGLKAAEVLMADAIAYSAAQSTPDDPCRTYFEQRPSSHGRYYWVEHYCWSYKNDDGSLLEIDGCSDYLSLIWYELQ